MIITNILEPAESINFKGKICWADQMHSIAFIKLPYANVGNLIYPIISFAKLVRPSSRSSSYQIKLFILNLGGRIACGKKV